jgi:hypothetical protein
MAPAVVWKDTTQRGIRRRIKGPPPRYSFIRITYLSSGGKSFFEKVNLFLFFHTSAKRSPLFRSESPSILRLFPSAPHNPRSFGNPFPGKQCQSFQAVWKRDALLSKIHNGPFKLLFEMMIAKNFTL